MQLTLRGLPGWVASVKKTDNRALISQICCNESRQWLCARRWLAGRARVRKPSIPGPNLASGVGPRYLIKIEGFVTEPALTGALHRRF